MRKILFGPLQGAILQFPSCGIHLLPLAPADDPATTCGRRGLARHLFARPPLAGSLLAGTLAFVRRCGLPSGATPAFITRGVALGRRGFRGRSAGVSATRGSIRITAATGLGGTALRTPLTTGRIAGVITPLRAARRAGVTPIRNFCALPCAVRPTAG